MNNLIKLILNTFSRTFLIKISFIIQPILGVFLKGNKFTDPIDEKSFSTFLPYGYNNLRKNALSPSTFSLERHRLLWLYLKNETDFFTKKIKLLHFAPEQAFYRKFKKLSNIDYDTIDLNSPIAKIKADICNLPIKDNTYDFVYSVITFQHISKDSVTNYIKEISRVLKDSKYISLQFIKPSMNIMSNWGSMKGYDFNNDSELLDLFSDFDVQYIQDNKWVWIKGQKK